MANNADFNSLFDISIVSLYFNEKISLPLTLLNVKNYRPVFSVEDLTYISKSVRLFVIRELTRRSKSMFHSGSLA